jgi:hypothetical protein
MWRKLLIANITEAIREKNGTRACARQKIAGRAGKPYPAKQKERNMDTKESAEAHVRLAPAYRAEAMERARRLAPVLAELKAAGICRLGRFRQN